MSDPQTCWTLIRAAVDGQAADREEFAERYAPVVRAYLTARWRGSVWWQDLDDAFQEVFVECLLPDGPLQRGDPIRPGGFRSFLFAVVRHVAQRIESCQAAQAPRAATDLELEHVPMDETSLSRVFDRSWAKFMQARTST
ncbi:MAG TPA: hypothetical protein VGX78_15215 [Pirellulales bacterium]|jgi:RNA polymerase sigma-70 factor (ECF subfamily)|nr:hypothetical protein [Pirellulales bacterium]